MELVGPSSPIMIIRLTWLLIGNVLGFCLKLKLTHLCTHCQLVYNWHIVVFLMNVAPTLVEYILNLKALTFHLLQVLCGDVGDSPSCLGYSLIQIRFSVSLNDASTFCVMVVSAYQFAGLQDNMNTLPFILPFLWDQNIGTHYSVLSVHDYVVLSFLSAKRSSMWTMLIFQDVEVSENCV